MFAGSEENQVSSLIIQLNALEAWGSTAVAEKREMQERVGEAELVTQVMFPTMIHT